MRDRLSCRTPGKARVSGARISEGERREKIRARMFREDLMRVFQRGVAMAAAALAVGLAGMGARAADYKPVTQEMLVDPPAGDWLQISRTYDEQRYSPLDQINK